VGNAIDGSVVGALEMGVIVGEAVGAGVAIMTGAEVGWAVGVIVGETVGAGVAIMTGVEVG